MKTRILPTARILAGITLTLTAPSLHAADLTWDITSGDGGTITPGSGNWNTTAGNLVWNNAGANPNVIWGQTNTTTPLNAAIFAGTDGAVDAYAITLGSQMAAQSLTFNNSGYKLTGSTVSLQTSSTTNGTITVAAGKTATINSILSYAHNRSAMVTVGSGGVLNLGGGMPTSNRPQLALTGEGTINITAGTYSTTIGNRNAAIINQTGGTWTMSDSSVNNLSHSIGNGAGRDVSYTVSGTGTLNVLSSNSTGASYTLSLGRSMGNFKSTLTLQSGGTLNVGVTADRFGQLNLGSFDADGNSLLDVQGGTLTVGTGQAANKLYFFAAGANAGKTATMIQSGGNSTINGIQFGANTGDSAGGVIGANAYAADSSATLRLSGGSLYVGALGITRDTAAAALPVTIQLQGGTLGAAQNWSSSLDMKLGTVGGGVTIRAADAGGNARTISLSGVLSDDGAVNGTLTKTGPGTLTLSGANSYTGGTTVSGGTLLWSGSNNLPAIGTLQVNAGGNFSVADGTARATSTAALGLASGALLAFDWNGESVDTLTSTAAATTAGTVGLVINNTSPSGSGGTLISSPSGGLTAAGSTQYLLANNTNYTAALTVTDTAVSIGAQSPATALTDAYWLGGQVVGAPGAMNLSNGTTTSNWATSAAGTPAAGVVPGGSAVNVIFGAAGATQQANVTAVTDLNLGSITFNDSAAVTLGGGFFLTLNSTSATAATSSGAGTAVMPGSAITVTSSANAANTLNTSIILATNQTWNIASDKTLTVGGGLVGTGSLTKADAGTLTLGGTNTYTGSTTINAGILSLTGPLTGGGAITISGNGVLATSSTGVISGAASIAHNSSGTSQLSGINSYTGSTTVGAGTLQLTGSGQLGGGNYAGAISIADGATFENAGSAGQTLSGAVTGPGGTLKLSGNGQLILTNAGNTYGALRIGDGRVFINTNAAALPAAATVNITGGILAFGTGASYGNPLTVGSGGGIVTRNSAGTNLTGTVTLPGSGTVSFNNDDARTYGLSIASGQTLTGNLTIQIGGNRTNTNLVGGVTLSGKLTGDGALTLASSGQAASPQFGTGVLTLTGPNDYSGGTTLSQGTLTVGTGGTLGATTGALTVGNDNTTAAGTNAILNLATGADTTVGSLSGTIATPTSGTNAATINTQTGRAFIVNQTANGSYAGVIAGTGGFTLGSGSSHALTLAGNNTYTGATTVAAGSLIITGAVASTSVVVNGALGGSGVMANATLSGAGSINPGNSPGILTAAATNPAGGLDYNFEFTVANTLPIWNAPAASGNDVLRLTDASAPFTAALGENNAVTIYLNVGSLTEGDVFTGGFYTDKNAEFPSTISGGTFRYFLADAGGATPYGGNTYTAYDGPLGFELATVPQSADFGAGTVNGYTTRFTVVPESSAALLGGLGLLSLLRRRRK